MVQRSDIKIGMWLVNNGPGTIPVYDNKSATGTPTMTIAVGQMIGQVIDFSNGPAGYVVLFNSDAIKANEGLAHKLESYLFSWESFGIVNTHYGAVNFSDLQPNITDAQIQQQISAMATASANGVTLSSIAKKAGDVVSDTITGAIPWKVVGVGVGVYVLLNWNKFFKPATIKK